MTGVFRLEQPAGEGQLIVLYVNEDKSAAIDPAGLINEVGRDAARLQADGWKLASLGGLPMRQMGTAGNIMFQSGGQYATQVAVVALYTR
jgi:hypothetical protein